MFPFMSQVDLCCCKYLMEDLGQQTSLDQLLCSEVGSVALTDERGILPPPRSGWIELSNYICRVYKSLCRLSRVASS